MRSLSMYPLEMNKYVNLNSLKTEPGFKLRQINHLNIECDMSIKIHFSDSCQKWLLSTHSVWSA